MPSKHATIKCKLLPWTTMDAVDEAMESLLLLDDDDDKVFEISFFMTESILGTDDMNICGWIVTGILKCYDQPAATSNTITWMMMISSMLWTFYTWTSLLMKTVDAVHMWRASNCSGACVYSQIEISW